jgi:hypothetical protein
MFSGLVGGKSHSHPFVFNELSGLGAFSPDGHWFSYDWYILSTFSAVGEWTSIRRDLEPSIGTRLYSHMVIVSQVLNLVKRKVEPAS